MTFYTILYIVAQAHVKEFAQQSVAQFYVRHLVLYVAQLQSCKSNK